MFCLGILGAVAAQTGGNPFEMVPRLKEIPKVETPSSPQSVESGNPFELYRDGTRPQAEVVNPIVTEKKQKPTTEINTPAVNSSKYDSFLFTVMMICLILLAVLLTLFRGLFAKIYRAIFNDNMLNQLYRENVGKSLPYIIIYCMFFINLGIFLLLLLKHYGLPEPDSYWKYLGQLILGITALFVLKHMVLSIIAYIFPVEKEAQLYSFTIMIFGIMLGLILAPVNLFLAYAPPYITQWLVYLTFAIIVTLYSLRTLRGLFMTNKYLLFHKFHFLLYICTVEIAPVLVLAKLIIKQLEG